MFQKKNVMLFLSTMLSSVSLFASDNGGVATMIEKVLFSLRSPFLIFLEREGSWSVLVGVIFLAIAVGIESYTIHRLLKKRCMFIVPRMIFINFIEQIVQYLVFFVVVVSAFVMPIEIGMIGSTIFELVFVFILFYARVIFSSFVFSWFDPSVDRVSLKKTMLLANGLSYAFLLLISLLSMVPVLNPYLG